MKRSTCWACLAFVLGLPVLAGEKQGEGRAAEPPPEPNGIILISNFMALAGSTFQQGHELGYLTYLHAESREKFLNDVRQFILAGQR